MKPLLSRLRRDERGVALVEFALSLPLTLLVFASIVEGSRMVWAYQTAASGVRDASRYLARVAPRDICAEGGSVAGYAEQLLGIVRDDAGGTSLFPTGMTVNSVTPSLSCPTGNYRGGSASIAQVTAQISITIPFAGVFGFAGQSLPTVTATLTDQSRVYGS